MMARIFMRFLALCVLVLLAVPSQAAENADADGEPEQQAEGQTEEQAEQQDGQADSDEDGEPAEGQPSPTDQRIEDDGEGDGPQRFIPSEEISLDLGVSFPADI